MWAKRGMLLGSFLGATLVVALLTIVPLYESSIAAIDLVFTFRQAPAVEVDLLAAAPTGPYDAAAADGATEAVAEQRARLQPWYPAAVERTLSRELRVIPPDTPDWLEAAAAWRAEALAWRDAVAAAQGVDPASLGPPAVAAAQAGEGDPEFPRPPYPQPAIEALQTRLITGPDIERRVELTAGEWPSPAGPPAAGTPLPVVIGEDLARLGALDLGDRTFLRPFISVPETFEVFEVAGIARAIDPGDPFWLGTAPGSLVVLTPDSFDAWLAPIPIDFRDDPWLRPQRGLAELAAARSWYLPLARDAVELETIEDLRAAVAGVGAELGRVSAIAVSTGLPDLVESFDVRSTVFGAPILAMLALVVAGALYFLVYTAALNLEREGPELALLKSRGAGSWQTVGIHLLQSGLIAVAAAVIGPFVARLLVAVTGRVPPMSDLTGGEALTVTQVGSLWPWVAGGALLTFATVGLAILPFTRRTVLELRTLAARPTRVSIWQRYYIDVFLIVIAAILLFELRQRGLVEGGEDVGLDPFAIASPALFLVAGALLLLRLLPWLLRAVGWTMARFSGLSSALPGWHLARNPVPYGRLALLVWLTTGFGAFALTYAQTLERSYDDRAGFAAGSDVRVVAPEAGYLEPPPATDAAAVYRGQAAPRLASRSAELLAVRPADFAGVVSWRSDYGAAEPEQLFGLLRPDGAAPDWGVELPADTTALRVEAVHIPGPGAEGAEPLQVMVRVADARARLWTFASTPVAVAAWSTAEITLDPAAARNPGPASMAGPLAVQSLWVERPASGADPILRDDEVLWDDLRAVSPAGETPLGDLVAAEFVPAGGLVVSEVDGDRAARAALQLAGTEPTDDAVQSSPLYRPGRVGAWLLPARDALGEVPHLARPPDPLRVLLDRAAALPAAIDVGDETLFGIEADQIPGTRVGTLGPVPTATRTTTTGTVVVDLDGLLQWLNRAPPWSLRGTTARTVAPQELWVATDDVDGALRFLSSQLVEEPELAITAAGAATDFSSRPVQVGLVAVLFVGAFTGVVLALAGVTGYVLVAVRRRAREMGVLRALGFARRGVAATFAVEQLVVLVVGALIGVAAGVGLMRLLIPFLQLGESAEEIVPGVILDLDPAVLGGYLAVVTVLVVGSVLWSTRTVSARRLSEVLREVDR